MALTHRTRRPCSVGPPLSQSAPFEDRFNHEFRYQLAMIAIDERINVLRVINPSFQVGQLCLGAPSHKHVSYSRFFLVLQLGVQHHSHASSLHHCVSFAFRWRSALISNVQVYSIFAYWLSKYPPRTNQSPQKWNHALEFNLLVCLSSVCRDLTIWNEVHECTPEIQPFAWELPHLPSGHRSFCNMDNTYYAVSDQMWVYISQLFGMMAPQIANEYHFHSCYCRVSTILTLTSFILLYVSFLLLMPSSVSLPMLLASNSLYLFWYLINLALLFLISLSELDKWLLDAIRYQGSSFEVDQRAFSQ